MPKLKRKDYDKLFEPMTAQLADAAHWIAETGQRVVIIFEGRDTAGKGGAIRALSERLNPRTCHVVALGKPSEEERGQWYFQRYVPHLPTNGQIALFDRSWYNRAGVERVMGFCTEAQTKTFLKAAPEFEHQLTQDGVMLFKYWLCCDQDKQEERFQERLQDPLKSWKLSPIDLEARKKYAEYTKAREAMLKATHTTHAPWTLVDFNDQKRGRLTLLRDFLDRLPDTKLPVVKPDYPPLEGKLAKEKYGVLKPIKDFEG